MFGACICGIPERLISTIFQHQHLQNHFDWLVNRIYRAFWIGFGLVVNLHTERDGDEVNSLLNYYVRNYYRLHSRCLRYHVHRRYDHDDYRDGHALCFYLLTSAARDKWNLIIRLNHLNLNFGYHTHTSCVCIHKMLIPVFGVYGEPHNKWQ